MASSEPGGDPVALIYVIGRVNQGIRREMRTRLQQHGLSVQEYTALSVLRVRPGLSNAQLARRSLVTPQSMIEILSKLERRGLVRRELDPAHGRILRARPTVAATDLLARADPAILAIQEEMLAGVAPDQREALLELMLDAMSRLSAGLTAPARAAEPRSP